MVIIMTNPLSMTAYGRGTAENENLTMAVEIRSVNHRHCDVRIKMARKFNGLTEKIKKEASLYYKRGSIEIQISSVNQGSEQHLLTVNHDLASKYHDCLRELANNLDLPASQDQLPMIASFPGVMETNEQQEELDAIWPVLRQALSQALESCQQMRQREGNHLKKDLLLRIDLVEQTLGRIEKDAPLYLAEREKSLNQRLSRLLSDSVDQARLAQEAAILADKTDITEELVRLASHIDQFRHYLNQEEPIGRRLDFLLQEFFREINTIASKINNADAAHHTVELKNEVEKMREQVQNLE